jgi:hypothetical protein
MRNRMTTPIVAAVAAGIALAGLTGCSADSVKQATDLGSSVASDVSDGVRNIDGSAIEQGMANVAGGIDGALDTALKGANVTSDGKVPDGFPASAVPLVDGTVLGGGMGPNGSGCRGTAADGRRVHRVGEACGQLECLRDLPERRPPPGADVLEVRRRRDGHVHRHTALAVRGRPVPLH